MVPVREHVAEEVERCTGQRLGSMDEVCESVVHGVLLSCAGPFTLDIDSLCSDLERDKRKSERDEQGATVGLQVVS